MARGQLLHVLVMSAQEIMILIYIPLRRVLWVGVVGYDRPARVMAFGNKGVTEIKSHTQKKEKKMKLAKVVKY